MYIYKYITSCTINASVNEYDITCSYIKLGVM